MATGSSEQQEDKSFAETNLHMLDNEILTDITFEAGRNKEPVKAHKFMLASRSPVFFAMFCGSLAERGDVVQVPDVEPDILRMLLRCLYADAQVCSISEESVMALLYAAKKYEVTAVIKKCQEFLQNCIDDNTENVCTILQQAVMLDEKTLIEICLSHISCHAAEVFQTNSFVQLSKESLGLILKSDDLEIDELHMFLASIRWAKHQCDKERKLASDENIRTHLGELLYLIRFPIMSATDFTTHVAKSEILSDKEKLIVFQSFHDDKLEQELFMAQSRNLIFSFGPSSDGFFEIVSPNPCMFNHAGQPCVTTFSCSHRVKLMAVSLFSPAARGIIAGALEVTNGEQSFLTMRLGYGARRDHAFYQKITLTSPLILRKDMKYRINLCTKGTSYCGEELRQSVRKEGVKLTFFESTPQTDARLGLLHGLYFE